MYKILRRVCHEEKRGIQSHGGFTVFFVGSPNISNHRLGGRAEQLGVRTVSYTHLTLPTNSRV